MVLPLRIPVTTCIFILPDGRFKRHRMGDHVQAEFALEANTIEFGSGLTMSHRPGNFWSVAIKGETIGDHLTVTRRLPKSPRFAHIPVYVLRKP